MGDKNNKIIPGPGDIGGSFLRDDYILNYRPKIDFVEPAQEIAEKLPHVPSITIDDMRDRTKNLINGLEAVAKLNDQAQLRIDQRVRNNGGLDIKLDAKKDAVTIAAMKRRFPNKENPTIISYDDYKQALECLNNSALNVPQTTSKDIQGALEMSQAINKDMPGVLNGPGALNGPGVLNGPGTLNGPGVLNGPDALNISQIISNNIQGILNVPQVTSKDIQDAQADPLRTNFGGVNNLNGENRPEISSSAAGITPIDTDKFQSSAVIALFILMLPLVTEEIKKSIAIHLVTAIHA